MSNAMYKRMYHAHVKTILSEFFSNGQYETMATDMMQQIEQAVLEDNHKFYSDTQFQLAMTDNVVQNGYTIPGIKTLMQSRIDYLNSTNELSALQPEIKVISSMPNEPIMGQAFTISATVSDAVTVYIGYRANGTQIFTRTLMYDDGMHNDGAAQDGIYATTLTMNSETMQYYIYAENDNAGIFSPQRAEYEYYMLSASTGMTYVTADHLITIYPNPANSVLLIDVNAPLTIEQLQILDISGREVLTITPDLNTPSFEINIHDLCAGIYMLRINQSVLKRLVVIK
jgi:hypothetical protein